MAVKKCKTIYTKTCPYCGLEFQTTNPRQLCCSISCAARRRRERERNEELILGCIYQEGIDCYDRTCDKCGWNPKVAEERLKKIRRAEDGK